MTSALPGLSSPAVGFEVPLEMLSACHGRVQSQCETLQRLRAHLAGAGADRAAQQAAEAVMRYFDSAAVHHHADEETDLFPALLEAVAGSDAQCVRALTEALQAEHRTLEAAWRRLRSALATVAAGTLPPAGLDGLDDFLDGYAGHIAREEGELLPMAQRLLDDAALDRLGRAMRERRGVRLPGDA